MKAYVTCPDGSIKELPRKDSMKKHDVVKKVDHQVLVSNCCATDFDAFGYEKEPGIWQERCTNCKKLCEPLMLSERDVANIQQCYVWNEKHKRKSEKQEYLSLARLRKLTQKLYEEERKHPTQFINLIWLDDPSPDDVIIREGSRLVLEYDMQHDKPMSEKKKMLLVHRLMKKYGYVKKEGTGCK